MELGAHWTRGSLKDQNRKAILKRFDVSQVAQAEELNMSMWRDRLTSDLVKTFEEDIDDAVD